MSERVSVGTIVSEIHRDSATGVTWGSKGMAEWLATSKSRMAGG